MLFMITQEQATITKSVKNLQEIIIQLKYKMPAF